MNLMEGMYIVKLVFLIDSGADVPAAVAAQRGFEVVPMHTTMGHQSFNDGEFPVKDLFDFYQTHGELPKTSAATPEDFTRAYAAIRAREPEAHIVYLAYSAATTCSFQNAHFAAEGMDNITMIDTKFVSAGQAAVVYHIADLYEKNPEITPEEIRAEVEDFQKKLHMLFVPGDLQYLKAGGRLSNVAYVGAKLLNLQPRIELVDGLLVCTHKYRGSNLKVYMKMLKEYIASRKLNKERFYFIESFGLDENFKREAESVVREAGFKRIEWIQTGGVVSVHCGPGSFGLVCVDE